MCHFKERKKERLGPQTAIWRCYPLLLAILQIYWCIKKKFIIIDRHRMDARVSGIPLYFMETQLALNAAKMT